MILLTDAITPHLDRCGVSFHVADPEETLAQRCQASNEMKSVRHLALHSNAGGNGKAWGPVAFYHSSGKDLADKLVANLLALGQRNNRSGNVVKNTSLYELRSTTAPAVLLEVDFHDSAVGVEFLTTRRAAIAEAIAKAIVEEDGKQWVPAKDSYQQEAAALGFFQPDETGSFRWSQVTTREDVAKALLALREHLAGGKTS